VAGLQRHPLFAAYAWPRRVTAPLYARYDPGMQYGAHVDGAIMAADGLRTDLSVTLFLAEPSEYDGGELALDLGGGALHSVKLPAGAAFVYPTGALHLVRPVTRGRRLVAVFWVQSYARDQGVREVLFDLRAVASSLNQQAPQSREAQLLLKSLSNLERRFAEP
jgi:PKHD-type hydroxylase